MGENEVVLTNGVSWCSQMVHELLTNSSQKRYKISQKHSKRARNAVKKRVTTNDKTANYQALTT